MKDLNSILERRFELVSFHEQFVGGLENLSRAWVKAW
jgi:hypothetical protein